MHMGVMLLVIDTKTKETYLIIDHLKDMVNREIAILATKCDTFPLRHGSWAM